MNILIRQKIGFNGLYKPLRTKEEKDRDYVSVDNQIRKNTLDNKMMEQRISYLEEEILSLVLYCQNVGAQDKENIEKKIETKKEEIKKLQNQIENNRAASINLWYGYHERL